MRLHVLSDLHLEFADGYRPTPPTDADVTVVAGDLGHSADALDALADWPLPVVFVPGNHEYDQQDIDAAEEELREQAGALGLTYLNAEVTVRADPRSGAPVRFVGVTRWCDFDLLGADRRDRCMRAARAYLRVMGSSRHGVLFGPDEVRELALQQREWLAAVLRTPFSGRTVVITHFGPSGRSADPRYGLVPGTASFCNADDDLLPLADLWIHGHLHCPHDYVAEGTRVVCNPRGYTARQEHLGFRPHLVLEV